MAKGVYVSRRSYRDTRGAPASGLYRLLMVSGRQFCLKLYHDGGILESRLHASEAVRNYDFEAVPTEPVGCEVGHA